MDGMHRFNGNYRMDWVHRANRVDRSYGQPRANWYRVDGNYRRHRIHGSYRNDWIKWTYRVAWDPG